VQVEVMAIAWSIIVIYFAAMIYIGLWSKRKIVSVEDYHIAGRKIGGFINGSAYIAGALSVGSFLGAPAFIFLLGTEFNWALLGIATSILFGAGLVAAQLRKAAPVSTTDYFAWRYETDRYGRALLTIAYMWGVIPYNVACLVGMGEMFVSLFHLHYIIALIIVTIVTLVYMWFGGMYATTLTSALQCWFMTAAIFAIVIGMFLQANPATIYELSKSMQPDAFVSGPYSTMFVKAMVKKWFDPTWLFASGVVATILWYFVWHIGTISMPYATVALFRTLDERTARQSLFWGGLFATLFYIAVGLIGFGIRPIIEVISPHPVIEQAKAIAPALPSLGVFSYYYKVYGIGSPTDYATIAVTEALRNPWLLGLVGAGVLSIAMSTIAAWSMVMGTIIARDWPRFILKRGPLPPNKEILVARLSMSVLLVISLLIAISPPAMICDLTALAYLVVSSICGPPLILGIWWKRGGPMTFNIYATVMLIATAGSWMYAYLVLGAPHACAFFPALATPSQAYWYFIGFVLWIILCLVTKQAKPETIKKYHEDLHTS